MHPIDALIPRAELKRRYGVSEMTIWRLEKAGKLPKPAAIINRRKLYRLADLEAWEASTVSHV